MTVSLGEVRYIQRRAADYDGRIVTVIDAAKRLYMTGASGNEIADEFRASWPSALVRRVPSASVPRLAGQSYSSNHGGSLELLAAPLEVEIPLTRASAAGALGASS